MSERYAAPSCFLKTDAVPRLLPTLFSTPLLLLAPPLFFCTFTTPYLFLQELVMNLLLAWPLWLVPIIRVKLPHL